MACRGQPPRTWVYVFNAFSRCFRLSVPLDLDLLRPNRNRQEGADFSRFSLLRAALGQGSRQEGATFSASARRPGATFRAVAAAPTASARNFLVARFLARVGASTSIDEHPVRCTGRSIHEHPVRCTGMKRPSRGRPRGDTIAIHKLCVSFRPP